MSKTFVYNEYKAEILRQVVELWKEVTSILMTDEFKDKPESAQLKENLKKYLIAKFSLGGAPPTAAKETDFIDTVARKISTKDFLCTSKEEWDKLSDAEKKTAINDTFFENTEKVVIQGDKLTAAQVASCFVGKLMVSSNIGKHFQGKDVKAPKNAGKGFNRRKVTIYEADEYENIARDLISKQFIRWFNSLIDKDGHLKARYTRPAEVRPISWTVRNQSGEKIKVRLTDNILVKLLSVRRTIGRGFLGSIRVGVYVSTATNLIFGCYGTTADNAKYKSKFWHLNPEAKADYEAVMKLDGLN